MAITIGQSATGTNQNSNAPTLTMGGAVTAGSGLTACSAAWKGGGAFTVTASDNVNAGNYTNDRQSTDTFGDMVTIASKLNTGAGTPTCTFTAASGSGTAFFGSIAFTEWKSLATSSAADTGASASGASNAGGNTGISATLAQTDEVALGVLAYGVEEANAINASGTVGTFVELVTWEGTGNVNSGIVYQIVSATTALRHYWTWTTNTAWVGIIETYKGGASGMTSTAAGTFPGFSGSASGQHPFTSTAAGTLPGFSGAATGAQTHSSTAVGTLPGFSGAATGAQAHTATAAGTFPGFSGSATGAQVHTATATGTFPGLSGAATGAQTHAATAAGAFPSFNGAATGTHSASGAADGTGVGTFPSFSGAATGAFPFTSTAAGTFPTFDGAAVALQTHTATAVGTFPSFDGSATAAMLPAATAAGTFPSFSGSASGVFGVLVLTPLKGTMLIELYLSGSAYAAPYLDGGMEVQGP